LRQGPDSRAFFLAASELEMAAGLRKGRAGRDSCARVHVSFPRSRPWSRTAGR